MNTGNGGPAFPDAGPTESGYANPGMSLRDYFAAAALQGMVAHDSYLNGSVEDQAKQAYLQADAMLEARK